MIKGERTFLSASGLENPLSVAGDRRGVEGDFGEGRGMKRE